VTSTSVCMIDYHKMGDSDLVNLGKYAIIYRTWREIRYRYILVWSAQVRCSSKTTPRLRAEWMVLSEERSYVFWQVDF